MKIDIKGYIVGDDEAWIYDWFGLTATCPKDIHEALTKSNGMPVDVEINSGGGSVFAGSEIYSALRGYSGPVNIHITGLAASAASVIAMAGHSDMSPTAQMMVHRVSMGGIAGNVHDMEHAAFELQKADEALAAAYVEKTGMSREEALNLMDRETWLTAEDAVAAGLVDEITKAKTPSLQMTAAVEGMIPQAVINKMNAEKAAIKADLERLKGEKNEI